MLIQPFTHNSIFGVNKTLNWTGVATSQHFWIKPKGCLMHYFFVIGAGGGGRQGSTTSGGGGGGAGGYVKEFIADAFIPEALRLQVGIGGVPGSAGSGSSILNIEGVNLVSTSGGNSGTASTTGGTSGSGSGTTWTGNGIFVSGSGGAGGSGGAADSGGNSPPTSAFLSGGAGGAGSGSANKGGVCMIPFNFLGDDSVNPLRNYAYGGDQLNGILPSQGITIYEPFFFSTGGSGGGGATAGLGQIGADGGIGSGGGGGSSGSTAGAVGGTGGNGIILVWSV